MLRTGLDCRRRRSQSVASFRPGTPFAAGSRASHARVPSIFIRWPVRVLEETLRGVSVANGSGSWRRGVCGSPAPGPAPPPRSLPGGSTPPAKHLDTSTSPLIPVCLHVTPCPWRGASFEKEGGVGKEETRVCLAPAGPRRGSHPWTALGQCSGRDGPCQSAGAWCYDSLALSCAENTKLLLAGGPVSLRCGQPKWEQRWRPLEWETLPAPLPREQLPEELPLRQCCARSGQATLAGRAVVACPVGPGCVPEVTGTS